VVLVELVVEVELEEVQLAGAGGGSATINTGGGGGLVERWCKLMLVEVEVVVHCAFGGAGGSGIVIIRYKFQ
jgi:hypothetical protein